MSRSRKKAIFKEGNPEWRKVLRRKVKRSQRNFMRTHFDAIALGDKVIPDEKSIVNEYDYCDYIIDYEHRKNSWWFKNTTDEKFNEFKEKISRK